MEREYRTLDAKGKCICCGKKIERKKEKVHIIKAHKSQVYQITICDSCVKKLKEAIDNEW